MLHFANTNFLIFFKTFLNNKNKIKFYVPLITNLFLFW